MAEKEIYSEKDIRNIVKKAFKRKKDNKYTESDISLAISELGGDPGLIQEYSRLKRFGHRIVGDCKALKEIQRIVELNSDINVYYFVDYIEINIGLDRALEIIKEKLGIELQRIPMYKFDSVVLSNIL